MSLPGAVFLDTSILAGQSYHFSSTALTAFVAAAKQREMPLLLPDPTEREIHRHLKDRSKEAVQTLDKFRRDVSFLHGSPIFKPFMEPVREWEFSNAARLNWNAFLAQFNVVRLDYSGIDPKTIMGWYNSATAPFNTGKKRKEFPDAFAVAIIEHYSREHNVSVAVVSEDPDFSLACDRFSSLLCFKRLSEITETLLLDPMRISALRDSLESHKDTIEDSLLDDLREREARHVDRRFSVREASLHSVVISDLRVVAIGSGECTIGFDAEYEGEFYLRWNEMSHDDFDQIDEWVLDSGELSGTAKVVVDSKSDSTLSVGCIELDMDDIEISKDPRRWR